MSIKRAVIYAETVVVLCPHCSEPLPAPDNGSDHWMIDQVRALMENAGAKTCNSCELKFHVAVYGTVQVDRKSYPSLRASDTFEVPE